MTQSSTPAISATDQLVELELLRLFQRSIPISQIMMFLAMCLVTVVLWPAEKPHTMLVWFSLGLIAIIFAIVRHRQFSRLDHQETLAKLKLWKRWVLLCTFVSGAVWGGGGVCLFPSGDALRLVFLCIFLLGMCSGGLPVTSPVQ